MPLMTGDADWAEREYNPRVTTPDALRLTQDWPGRAAAFRAAHPFEADLPYGPHPRERWDLFRVPHARGTVVYIHGGYWRAFSKVETSWVGEAFLAQGLNVALLNYPLCPEVDLGRIRESTIQAFATLWQDILRSDAERRVVVTGHSAGGYMAALHMATDWTRHGMPAAPLAGCVSLSGVFDLVPLLPTSMNELIRLTPETARSWSLLDAPLRTPVPLVLAVGARESEQFHRQSDAMAAAWPQVQPHLVDVPGRTHFDIMDEFAIPGSPLNAAVLDMLA